ncbi:YhjD/YihY/BrkB family envelope integrity protein [Longibacter sp.]|uniref:YihY/virulence factor BrkB family protein n=1 Tax=Longibacter sp. TaxID=2045415 RepID=UPI003EB81465
MNERPFSATWIQRARAHGLYYARGLYAEIAGKNLFLWAQAIAFKVLVTIVPIVILATGLVGRVLRGNDAFAAVARFIHDFLPPSQSHQVVTFLHQLQVSSGTIVGIGGVGLFLSAVSLFITLRIAVGNAFEQDWHESRSIVGGYLFDVRMVLQVGLLFVVTIGMSVFAQSIDGFEVLAFAGLDQPWARESWRHAIRTLGLFVPFFITTAMFFQLYYLVPKPHPRKRSALTGALIAGVLWEMAKQIFTYYATYVGQFERYATEGLGALGNTFALIIAFVFWVYFSGIVLMLGAVVASLREHRHVTAGLLPGEEREDDRSPAERADESSAAPAAAPSSADADPEPTTHTPDDVAAPQPARRTVEDAASVPAGDPNPPSGDGADPGADTPASTAPDPASAAPSPESSPNTSADEAVDATVQDREGQP